MQFSLRENRASVLGPGHSNRETAVARSTFDGERFLPTLATFQQEWPAFDGFRLDAPRIPN